MTEQTFLVIESGDITHRIMTQGLQQTTRLLLVLSGELCAARQRLIEAVDAAVEAYDNDCCAARRSSWGMVERHNQEKGLLP